ncbi:MAG: nuclear transport factor 2 family protein [Streptosporangiaceae bacterium]
MTDAKITTVQSVYEAFSRADIGFILDQLTDDVDWASCPDSDIAPWHGIHKGKAEVPNFFKALGESVEITEFTPLSFAANETDVMVVTHWSATSPATGKTATMDIHHWWRFRDGKIYLYRGTEDTAQTQNLLRND